MRIGSSPSGEKARTSPRATTSPTSSRRGPAATTRLRSGGSCARLPLRNSADRRRARQLRRHRHDNAASLRPRHRRGRNAFFFAVRRSRLWCPRRRARCSCRGWRAGGWLRAIFCWASRSESMRRSPSASSATGRGGRARRRVSESLTAASEAARSAPRDPAAAASRRHARRSWSGCGSRAAIFAERLAQRK